MVNYTVCKSCLFFSAGAVERRPGTGGLDKLGGLSRAMPLTFAAFMIAALGISGVPR
jgi:formate hydrogenlyase subunit 3/multisubunit Na+/H+ antiporter MnhD subunit